MRFIENEILERIGFDFYCDIANNIVKARAEMGWTQKKLAELLHVSPATVANSLKSLERGGYVRKEADPADARCNRVFLTDRGRRAVQECAEVFDAVDQQVLRGFSPGELEQLRSFHQRMLDNLRQIGGDCTPCCPAHSPFSNGKE